MADQFKRIRSAVVDGRAQTPRYIQRQLTNLHEALKKNQQALHNAIRRDADYSAAEADAEVYATLKAVKDSYESIDFTKFIEQEFSLASAQDNLKRRTAIGIVYIIPSQHNQFYSTVQPLATAIAAGNCVMVEISQTLSELAPLLRNILTSTLDKDTVAVVNSKPDNSDYFSRRVAIVDGRSEPSDQKAFRVLSAPSSRAVAVVDRSANVTEAARSLVRARFAFRGRSPYAPDQVFVNEFVLQQFMSEACRFATEQAGVNMPDGNFRKEKVRSSGSLQKDMQQSGGQTMISGSRGSVVLVQERKSSLLSKKIAEPVLVIHAIRSLDDAIDLTNSKSNSALATYIFGAPNATKYLSQFIDSRVSFINHIPVDLLIGPATPKDYTTTLQSRYTTEMLSTPHPEHVTVSSDNDLLNTLLDKNDKETRSKFQKELAVPLTPMKQPRGHQIGFFEQGLITGGVILLTSVVTVAGVSLRYGVPAVLKRVR